MAFDASQYGVQVENILAEDGDGGRPMPLAGGKPVRAAMEELSRWSARDLFPEACSPEAALSGLYLYFCAYDESHKISQDIETAEGSFWHGIMHRQEPDAGNAAYWFRRVGQHSIFPQLRDAAERLGFRVKERWDPFAFIDFCEDARKKPGSKEEQIAMAVQLAEWQLLFDYCARAKP
jgi:hypothetical protein